MTILIAARQVSLPFFAPFVKAVAAAITSAMESVPPEIAHDIVENGVILVGGGAALDGLDNALRQLTGVPVLVAEDPAHAVARGTWAVLQDLELTRALAC